MKGIWSNQALCSYRTLARSDIRLFSVNASHAPLLLAIDFVSTIKLASIEGKFYRLNPWDVYLTSHISPSRLHRIINNTPTIITGKIISQTICSTLSPVIGRLQPSLCSSNTSKSRLTTPSARHTPAKTQIRDAQNNVYTIFQSVRVADFAAWLGRMRCGLL